MVGAPISSHRVELGLIGFGIGRSMSPMLHELLGSLTGRTVSYPSHDRDASFADSLESFLHSLADRGVVGVNVTHPFKELAASMVRIDDESVAALGAVNTVRFDADGPVAFNTDYTGMMEAYRRRFGDGAPGTIAQFGAGGFGRAGIFAMAELGAQSIRLYDPDRARAEALASQVMDVMDVVVDVTATAEAAARGADGIINASPIGMHIHPGCPVDPDALAGASWVFDAVYAPLQTELLRHAGRLGAIEMSGSELFFWQGIHAFEHFLRTTVPTDVVEQAAAVVQAEITRRSAEGR